MQDIDLTKRISSPWGSNSMLGIIILQRRDLEKCKNLLFWFRNVFYMKNPKLCPYWDLSTIPPDKSRCYWNCSVENSSYRQIDFLFTLAEQSQRLIFMIWSYFQQPFTHQMSSTTIKVQLYSIQGILYWKSCILSVELVKKKTMYKSSNLTISKHILVLL